MIEDEPSKNLKLFLIVCIIMFKAQHQVVMKNVKTYVTQMVN